MNDDNGKIRAKLKDGAISVRVLMRHPMETGSRKDPSSGETIARHFIREVVCEHNGKRVLSLDWGWGISANPYLAFEVKNGAAGDTIAVRWIDDRDASVTLETTAKP
jgi:sulfur-oxidizing protein SoxZ